MRNQLLLISLLISLASSAQFSKADARITTSIDGETAITLMDSVKIALGTQESGWYPVTTKAYVPKSKLSGDSTLAAETELLNRKKDPIGQVVKETKVKVRQAEGRGLYKYYEVLITGFIKGTSFHYRSIPERGIENIMRDKRVSTRQENLQRYFKKMGFEAQETGNYTVYAYLDETASFDQPVYRTLVFYRGETLLYCVVSRNEFMSFEKLKDERDDSTGKYYFFQRPPDKTWNEIKDIVWGYIPL